MRCRHGWTKWEDAELEYVNKRTGQRFEVNGQTRVCNKCNKREYC